MTANEQWIVIIEPLPIALAREEYERWKSSHPNALHLSDNDIRIDLIRTTSGDRVRYLLRAEAWQSLGGEIPRGQFGDSAGTQ